MIEPPQELRQKLREIGAGFLQEFLEVELSRHPENVEALAELGQIYTDRGLWDLGLGVDQRLVALTPLSPLAHYNLACSQSLLGLNREALDSLDSAIERGYADAEHMLQDGDLVAIREEPRFRSQLERIRAQNAADPG